MSMIATSPLCDESLTAPPSAFALVVGEHPLNTAALAGALRAGGFATLQMRSHTAALLTAWIDPPDVVVLDLEPTPFRGLRLLARWRALEQACSLTRAPILAIAGSAGEQVRQRCLEQGADDVVPRALVDQLLARRARALLHDVPRGVAPSRPALRVVVSDA